MRSSPVIKALIDMHNGVAGAHSVWGRFHRGTIRTEVLKDLEAMGSEDASHLGLNSLIRLWWEKRKEFF